MWWARSSVPALNLSEIDVAWIAQQITEGTVCPSTVKILHCYTSNRSHLRSFEDESEYVLASEKEKIILLMLQVAVKCMTWTSAE